MKMSVLKWAAGIGGAIGLVLITAYVFRVELILHYIRYQTDAQTPVGEHQSVTWGGAALDRLEAPRSDGPPNVILIVADDLGWNDLTFNGGGLAGGTVPTPNIDRIAHEGAIFMNGYAAHGTCAPSRASLMSGRYSTRFGFEFTPTPDGMLRALTRLVPTPPGEPEAFTHFEGENDGAIPFSDMGMPPSEITLAETMRDAGYYTAHIGKWHLGRSAGMMPHEQGFEDSLLMHSGLYLPENSPDVENSYQDFDPIDRFLWAGMQYAASFNGSAAFEPGGYITDYYTEEAVNVIEQNRQRPFFLYLAHWAPHSPLQASREDYDALSHIEDHRLRVYAAMIRALDRGVGEVLDALEENGIADNTLVIFTSDNGGPGYIGLPEINEPYRGWKLTFFEGGIHVPYFMRWPGTIPAGTRVNDPVHHFDIYATAADAGGASIPGDRVVDGVSLLPYVTGDTAVTLEAPHDHLFWLEGGYQAVMADGWKLQRDARQNLIWLFDLSTDPNEQSNVAAEHPERVAELVALLDAHDAEQMEPNWPALLEAPVRIDQTLDQPWHEDDEYIYWPN